MPSKFLEVDPHLVWQKGRKAEDMKMLTGRDFIKPWSDLRELPEFSYKTSYQIGYPHHYEFDKFFEPPAQLKKPEGEERYKYQLFKNQYKTTSGTTYVKKTLRPEPGEKPSFLDYMDTQRERFQKKMFLAPTLYSEYCANYTKPSYNRSLAGVFKEQKTESFCNPPQLAKKAQPFIDPNEGGARREKDIYTSQTHYEHYYISPRKVSRTQEPLVTPDSGIQVYCNPTPIDPFLRLPFRQGNLLKKVLTVPHRGMITETQENYIPQVDIFAVDDPKVKIEEPPQLSREVIQKNMIQEMEKFHTEYDHIGSNWSTQNI